MKTIYYDKTTGYLCNRYPKDIEKTDESLSIEVNDEDEEKTYACPYGKFWAVKNGILQLVDDVETQATTEYKNNILKQEKTKLEQYLSDTDYIIAKLNELKLEEDETYETVKAQYSEQLTKRKEARTRINEIESILNG